MDIAENEGNAASDKEQRPEVDDTLRRPACYMRDDDGCSKRREDFIAVTLRCIRPRRFAAQIGEKGSRLVVISHCEAAEALGISGAEDGQKNGDENAPVSEDHGGSLIVSKKRR